MGMKARKVTHPLIRPPDGATDVLRLTARGTWIADDGKPGRAFSGRKDRFPYAWKPRCSCVWRDACPGERAMRKTSERFGCANGRTLPEDR